MCCDQVVPFTMQRNDQLLLESFVISHKSAQDARKRTTSSVAIVLHETQAIYLSKNNSLSDASFSVRLWLWNRVAANESSPASTFASQLELLTGTSNIHVLTSRLIY